MDKAIARREVRGAIIGEMAFRMLNIPSDRLDESADLLTNAVMKRLEALDATVLERPSPIVMPYEAV